jgi:hypothetical protein
MHLLVISYLLKMPPARLVSYGMRSHLKGADLDECVAENSRLQRRRSRGYRRLLGASLAQHEGLLCSNCQWHLSEAHPRATRGLRRSITPFPGPVEDRSP